ncbi:MAG: hypothetical protein ACTSXG_04210 [Alphaproteobacteria bacterium]
MMKKIILLMVVFITACTGVKNNSFTYKGKPINPFCLPWYHGETGEYNPQNIEEGLKKLEEYKNDKDYRVEEEYDEKEKKYTVRVTHIYDGKDGLSDERSCKYIKQVGGEHLIEVGSIGGNHADNDVYFVTIDGAWIRPGDILTSSNVTLVESDVLSWTEGIIDGDFVRYIVGIDVEEDLLYEGNLGWRHGINQSISLVFNYDIKIRGRSFIGVELADLKRNEETNFCSKEKFAGGDLICKEENFDRNNEARRTFNKIYIKYAKKCAVSGNYAFLSGENLENFRKDLYKAFKEYQ